VLPREGRLSAFAGYTADWNLTVYEPGLSASKLAGIRRFFAVWVQGDAKRRLTAPVFGLQPLVVNNEMPSGDGLGLGLISRRGVS
jgi:hypothetical protein